VIEQAMIFALGFLFAGLAALAFAPAFWRRAIRLTRRRLEMQVPLSVQEILAERDQLRAEFAVEQRRIELRAAQTNAAHGADRSELGRRAAEINTLKENLVERLEENREYAQMLTQLQRDLSEVTAELGGASKELYDADGLYQHKQDEFIKLTKAHEAMSILADERLANHAAADARAGGLELRLGDVSRKLLETEKRLTEKTVQAAKFADALAHASRNLELSEGNYAALQKKLESEVARAALFSQELGFLRQQRDADQGKLRSLTIKVGVHEAAIEDANRREKKIRAQRDHQVEKVREAEHALAAKYDHLQSEYAALQGALEAARHRCETLETDLSAQRTARRKNPPTGSESEENALLRQEVNEVGAAIVRLAKANAEFEPNGAPEKTAKAETSGDDVPVAPAESKPAERLAMSNQVGS
jgi:chromosome segregation ATPase